MTLRRNVPVLMVTVAAMLASRLTWGRLLPTYYAALGATERQIGTAFTLFSAACALFQLLGGLLADRVGRKPVAVLPILGVVVAVAGMARAANWQQLLVGHLALGVFASAQSPGFTALLAESVPAHERGKAFGAVTFSARLANAAGPAIGAWLLTLVSFPSLLWLTVVVGIGVTAARLAFLRETLGHSQRDRASQSGSTKAEPAWKGALTLLVLGSLYAGLVNLLSGGPFIALHAHQTLGIDERGVNWLFALGNGAAILAAPISGWLADRVGYRRTMVAATALMSAGTLAWALLPRGLVGTACFMLGTAAGPAAGIAYNALLTGAVGPSRRGAFVGLIGTVTGLLGSPAARVGAELQARLGPEAPFWTAVALSLLLSLALLASAHPLRVRDGGSPSSSESPAA